MKKLVPIPPESLKRLKKDDVKDFGYQFVSVKLKDDRAFVQAVASEGCLIQVKGFREIPFVETDIESVNGDGKPRNFRRRAVRTRTARRNDYAANPNSTYMGGTAFYKVLALDLGMTFPKDRQSFAHDEVVAGRSVLRLQEPLSSSESQPGNPYRWATTHGGRQTESLCRFVHIAHDRT